MQINDLFYHLHVYGNHFGYVNAKVTAYHYLHGSMQVFGYTQLPILVTQQ